jgi:hypothetical protein
MRELGIRELGRTGVRKDGGSEGRGFGRMGVEEQGSRDSGGWRKWRLG